MPDLSLKLKQIKKQQPKLASLSLGQRNQILRKLARFLWQYRKLILRANKTDQKQVRRAEMKDRLILTSKRIRVMAKSLFEVAKLPDSLNKVLEIRKPKNGLVIKKVSVPLGTVAVIYESRPNVTVDLASLALKSGNALVLKGGSEAYCTNKVLVDIIRKVLRQNNLPQSLIYLISPKDDWKKVLLSAYGLIDVIIPRGGESLIRWVRQNSKLPIIETGAGVCHTFVDEKFNLKDAVNIIVNAKTQRPSVCNALDTLVIHQLVIKKLLPVLAAPLAKWRVEIFADNESCRLLKNYYPADLLKTAKPEHYGREFLSLKMAIKTVKNFAEGLKFVKENTSGHSEAILSKDRNHINTFLTEIDAAVVYANASTRFTDGGEFGMGAEVGISTQKLHARGPMGLEALTSYKWVVVGQGQIRK